jgi:DNA-binding beta-propeller fold protein YncE
MPRLLLCLLALTSSLPAAKEPIPVFRVEGLVSPVGLAFDTEGDAYVLESVLTNRILKVQGVQTEHVSGIRWAGGPKGSEPPRQAKRLDPAPAVYHGLGDIAVGPDGSIYASDSFQHRIVRLDPKSHAVTVFAGTGRAGFSGDGGPASDARFDIPCGIGIDPSGKSLVVADLGNHRVRRIDLATKTVTTIAGNGQPGLPRDGADALAASMDHVRSTCVAKDGTLYALLIRTDALVAIKDGKVEVVVNKAGQTGPAADGSAAEARMNKPKHITLDARDNVLIADTENHCVRLFDTVRKTIRTIAGNGQAGDAIGADWTTTRLNRPLGMRIGRDGRLYVADSENNRILVGPAP